MAMGRNLIAVFFCSSALIASYSSAQEAPSSSGMSSGTGEVSSGGVHSEEAIPVGPFIFSPALQLAWQDRDNIFFTPDNEIRDQLILAKARLLFEVPVYESYIQFSYTPQYREYKDYELDDKWQHFFDAAAAFEFSSGLTLNLAYSYIIGNLETREIDPGGEVFFGDRRFDKQSVRIGGDYWITGRDGFIFDFSWEDLEHEDPRLFYDYTRLTGGFGWLHQISPILVMDVKYGVIDFDAHDSEFENNDYRDSMSHSLTVGFRGQLSPVVATELRVGYGVMQYDPKPDEPQVEDFEGAIVNGFISWDMAHGSVLRLTASIAAASSASFAAAIRTTTTHARIESRVKTGRTTSTLSASASVTVSPTTCHCGAPICTRIAIRSIDTRTPPTSSPSGWFSGSDRVGRPGF
jgi:hypothetical protein